MGGGDDKGAVIEGIYQWDGADDFKVCAKIDGKERPTEFKSPENSHIVLIVFKRQAN